MQQRLFDGSNPHDVYDMVMSCVEKPMLEVVLAQAGCNQSLAAEYLGISRNTLRKKLQQHRLLQSGGLARATASFPFSWLLATGAPHHDQASAPLRFG